ncbi:tripartite tricarboxylate transporter substrate binding protein [Achromobacter sp. GG226]|uniref:Bug family tripartite tricarboxylate transporter substrate binding protein n=1 Tax=Verticiella alkaliphila TaxID=2779529 RepID=UPI001C0E0A2A|nr:tripartite tricarboxylate transporter substrate-binding protein [Verticiella sp. GG226]MBU4609736.1 tripartite tricarboxylate transporter substrate binding protein [Verticiella sp. GG226]
MTSPRPIRFLVAAMLVLSTGSALAAYPEKPVRLVVGYTAGGASDLVGRILAQALSELNGQPVIVENRPGVGGMLGLSEVAKSTPDGYTLGVAVSGTMVTGPHLQENTPYDPLTDFAPVSMVAKAPMILLASPQAQATTVQAIIEQAKREPGSLMYAAGAQAFDLAMRLFNAEAGVQIGAVPYPGGSQAAVDVIAGRVPMMVDTIGAQQANVKSGKLKAVAVLDDKRSAVMPEVPTIAESGVPSYQAVGWLGIVAPRETPPDVVEKLNGQLQQILARPDVAERLTTVGFEPDAGSSEAFAQEIQRQHALWGEVAMKAGLKTR